MRFYVGYWRACFCFYEPLKEQMFVIDSNETWEERECILLYSSLFSPYVFNSSFLLYYYTSIICNKCHHFGAILRLFRNWSVQLLVAFSLEPIILKTSHLTLHLIRSSAIHPLSVKSIGWTVVEKIEGQTYIHTHLQTYINRPTYSNNYC